MVPTEIPLRANAIWASRVFCTLRNRRGSCSTISVGGAFVFTGGAFVAGGGAGTSFVRGEGFGVGRGCSTWSAAGALAFCQNASQSGNAGFPRERFQAHHPPSARRATNSSVPSGLPRPELEYFDRLASGRNLKRKPRQWKEKVAVTRQPELFELFPNTELAED
jgi:hypothetical protein